MPQPGLTGACPSPGAAPALGLFVLCEVNGGPQQPGEPGTVSCGTIPWQSSGPQAVTPATTTACPPTNPTWPGPRSRPHHLGGWHGGGPRNLTWHCSARRETEAGAVPGSFLTHSSCGRNGELPFCWGLCSPPVPEGAGLNPQPPHPGPPGTSHHPLGPRTPQGWDPTVHRDTSALQDSTIT